MVDKEIPLETKWKGNMLTHNIHSARARLKTTLSKAPETISTTQLIVSIATSRVTMSCSGKRAQANRRCSTFGC